MADLNIFYATWTPRFLSVLRIIVGFLFIWHGSQKFFGFPPAPQGMMPDPLPAILVVAAVLEFFGGLLILFGLLTHPVAFLLSGLMAVAYFMGHASGGFLPLQNGGETAVLYCFVFLFLAVAGGGEWSLDNLFWRREKVILEA
ncbi:MAG TPA: DoxX family protein [Pyrinomonadaceae bacterium]|nr:DoxX family protein [Pyrinomonadaceae bacterium]